MRIPVRPRLPDGDCVFISGVRIVARANFAPTADLAITYACIVAVFATMQARNRLPLPLII